MRATRRSNQSFSATVPKEGWIASLLPAASWFLKLANLSQNSGTDRGGMLVEAAGLDAAGHGVTAQWSLIAEAGDGPNVPILPTLALIQRLLDGKENMRGAINCAGLLKLDEIERGFSGFRITTELTHSQPRHCCRRSLVAGQRS